MKDHSSSPVKRTEQKLDSTGRSYVIRDGKAYRLKSKAMCLGKRKWVMWTDITGDALPEIPA